MSEDGDSAAASGESQKKAPYESALEKVVENIRNQLFLFVIAIAIVLVGLVVLAPHVELLVIGIVVGTIAILTLIAVLLYATRGGGVEKPIAPVDPELEQRPTGPPKYATDARGASGLVIGDNAQVTQNIEPPSDSSEVLDPSHLEALLESHRRNLDRLQQKLSLYAPDAAPMELQQEVQREEEAIAQLERGNTSSSDEAGS